MKKQSTAIMILRVFEAAFSILIAFHPKSEAYTIDHSTTLNWDVELGNWLNT